MKTLYCLVFIAAIFIYVGNCRVVGGFSNESESEESGSGDEEDTLKLTKNQNVEQVVSEMKRLHNTTNDRDLSQSLKSGGSVLYPGTDNLMAEEGARQVMHTIASKLVSHTSNKITNHVGSIIKSSLTGKETDVSSDASKKSLSSSTEVVLPALSIAKLSEKERLNETAPSNQSAPSNQIAPTVNQTDSTNQTVIQRQMVDKESDNQKISFVKAPRIGPLETISIRVNGATSAYNNFTKLNKEPESLTGKKVDALKFEDGLLANSDEISKKSNTNKKSLQQKKKKKKSHKKKTKKHKLHKKSTKSRKSERNQFPKIILYQGPISKALESMLNVQSTPSKQIGNVVKPMTFEEATADIKRSNIERAPQKEEDDKGDDDEDDKEIEEEHENANKKSKVAKGKTRKYSVRGYSDSKQADKKSLKSKKPKSESGKKKYLVSFDGKRNKNIEPIKAVPILTINPLNNNNDADDDNKPLYDDVMKQTSTADRIANYKPSIVPNDSNPQPNQLTDFIKQMNSPVTNSPNEYPDRFPPLIPGPFPDNFMENGNSIKTSPPLHKTNDGASANRKIKKINPAFDFPNPAGYTTMGGSNGNAASDDQDDDDETDEVIYDSANATNSTENSIVDAPLEENPKEIKNNPGTPKPVKNAPDVEDSSDTEDIGVSQDDQEKQNKVNPIFKLQKQIQHLPQEEEPMTPELVGLPAPPPQSVKYPSNVGPIVKIKKPTEEDRVEEDIAVGGAPLTVGENTGISPEEEVEVMELAQTNRGNIQSLTSEVRDVESRLVELEKVVNDIKSEVEVIEKKIEHQHATNSFSEFAGPLSSVQETHRPPHIYGRPSTHRPKHLLKQFFVPLPPANSLEANAISNGAPVPGLPSPLNLIVSKVFRQMQNSRPQQLQKSPMRLLRTKPWHYPQPLPDVPLPPREHDIDRLEMELGRVPITRINNKFSLKKPRIIFLSKEPSVIEDEKTCDETCENGGQCLGGNICKCPSIFTGPKCEQPVHRSILEIFGQPEELDVPKKSNTISLPIVMSEDTSDEEDSSNQKTIGQVDQNKLVDFISQFSRDIPTFLPGLVKRNRIPQKLYRLRRQFYKRK